MATLDYIEIPAGSTRLRSLSEQQSDKAHDIRPAPRRTTSIPNPSPPPTPPTVPKRRPSLLSTTANSLNSPTMTFIPQMLLSAALPPVTPGPTPTTPTMPNPKQKGGPENFTLLSTRDPLSLPIMSTNFKRFVSIVGPVFWLQDRIEEIVLWKRGSLRTSVWMAAYALICFYPRLLLLLPHLAVIGIILATYPYPATSEPLYSINDLGSKPSAVPPPMSEGSVPWQANIQGIQNLMGAVADLHALVEPHVYHLLLTPQHLSPSTNSTPRSPYTAHILMLLVVSFFPLLFIIHLPVFPLREVCLLAGLVPLFLTNPYVKAALPVLGPTLLNLAPVLFVRAEKAKKTAMKVLGLGLDGNDGMEEGNEEEKEPPIPFSMILQRVMDDDRLSDECWNSEMREVQLWENERFGGPLPADSPSMLASSGSGSGSSSSTSGSGPLQKGWSKLNLKPGERGPWTRGQDGWSAVGKGGNGIEGDGEVSSNLTFSLAPGWRFVESEDWRKDLRCAWSGCSGDPDGWVYTNDAWLGSRPTPYMSGGGSVTRKRRWVRRVWYDPQQASQDS